MGMKKERYLVRFVGQFWMDKQTEVTFMRECWVMMPFDVS